VAEMSNPATIAIETIQRRILIIRGQKVVLDATLAELYGVATKALNQAAKRNLARFPEDFAFQLTPNEWAGLAPESGQTNRSQIVTGSQKHRDPRHLPRVFTEHGALMAANILRSWRAVQRRSERDRLFQLSRVVHGRFSERLRPEGALQVCRGLRAVLFRYQLDPA
jgi:ORF6N domain